jgi:hypothetical protein
MPRWAGGSDRDPSVVRGDGAEMRWSAIMGSPSWAQAVIAAGRTLVSRGGR